MITHRTPFPPDKGDRIRTYNVLRFLASVSRVDLATLADEPVPDHVERGLREVRLLLAEVRAGEEPLVDERVAAAVGELRELLLPAVAVAAIDREHREVERRARGVAVDGQRLLEEGLGRARVAAIGPIVVEALGARGVRAAIVPEKSFVMRRLVNEIVAALGPGAPAGS